MVFMASNPRGPSPLRPPQTPMSYTPSGQDGGLSPLDVALHPTFYAGRVAVVTGAASGIGRAGAVELAKYVLLLLSR